MFINSQFKTLFDYHFHTNERLLSGAAELSETEINEDPGYGRGSIHGLLFHLLNVSYGWRVGLESGNRPPSLPKEDYPAIATLQTGFQQEKANWDAHFQALNDTTIQGDIDLTWGERTMSFPYWRVLQHIIIHGTQHQSELAHLLTKKGHSPGDLDFIFYDWGNY